MNIIGDIVNNLKRNLPFTNSDSEAATSTADSTNPPSASKPRPDTEIKVREVMTENIETVSRITKIADAARTMRDSDVGFLPVVDDGKLVGVITDRDITVRVVAEGRDPAATPVDRYYTPHAITISPDASIEEAAHLMGSQQIRRLLVVQGGQILGVLSLGDVATQAADEQEVGEALAEVSEPGGPHQNEPNHR